MEAGNVAGAKGTSYQAIPAGACEWLLLAAQRLRAAERGGDVPRTGTPRAIRADRAHMAVEAPDRERLGTSREAVTVPARLEIG